MALTTIIQHICQQACLWQASPEPKTIALMVHTHFSHRWVMAWLAHHPDFATSNAFTISSSLATFGATPMAMPAGAHRSCAWFLPGTQMSATPQRADRSLISFGATPTAVPAGGDGSLIEKHEEQTPAPAVDTNERRNSTWWTLESQFGALVYKPLGDAHRLPPAELLLVNMALAWPCPASRWR